MGGELRLESFNAEGGCLYRFNEAGAEAPRRSSGQLPTFSVEFTLQLGREYNPRKPSRPAVLGRLPRIV